MNIEKVSIVTALFDIGRDKWDEYYVNYQSYLFWMSNLLKYDLNFIIYTEQKFVDFITTERKKIDPNLSKTKIIVKKLEDLSSYKNYYKKITSLVESDNFKSKITYKVPEHTKPLYNVVIFEKIMYIKESIIKNHFDSDMFIWLDAGVIRDNSHTPILTFPNIELINDCYCDKITFFSHTEEVKPPEPLLHILGQWRFIHGGCFLVPNNNCIDDFIKVFFDKIDNYLVQGYIGSEEKYYDLCYIDNPDNYYVIKSDWRKYFEILK